MFTFSFVVHNAALPCVSHSTHPSDVFLTYCVMSPGASCHRSVMSPGASCHRERHVTRLSFVSPVCRCRVVWLLVAAKCCPCESNDVTEHSTQHATTADTQATTHRPRHTGYDTLATTHWLMTHRPRHTGYDTLAMTHGP